MAIDIANISTSLGTKLITFSPANATPSGDVIPGSCTIHMIEIDNTANGSDIAYLKIINGDGTGTAGVITVGTDAPEYVFHCPAGTKLTYLFPETISITSKLRMWCVTGAGTAGTTSPSGNVKVEVLVS
tara:strand:+ start:686 stop:1072 length:387 start_codon:yes stop_codon:yes gene_type:complete